MSEEVIKRVLGLYDQASQILTDVQGLKSSYEWITKNVERDLKLLSEKKLSPDQISAEISKAINENIGWDAVRKEFTEIITKEAKEQTGWSKIDRIVKEQVKEYVKYYANKAIDKALSEKEVIADLTDRIKKSIGPLIKDAFSNVTLNVTKTLIKEEIEKLPQYILDNLNWRLKVDE